MSLTPHSAGSTAAGDTPVTVRPDLHPGTEAALSELDDPSALARILAVPPALLQPPAPVPAPVAAPALPSSTTEEELAALFTIFYFVLVERLGGKFRPRQPQACSIYDRRFWEHERYWKLVVPQVDKALAGTPFKNLVSRLLGTRIGKRVFDDGATQTERTLVTIGDDCTLNDGSSLQCHSQEDGAFKSDRTALGARVTVGVGTLVHYGVVIGDGAVIGPDTFLMKGEEVPPGERWGGNPAQEMNDGVAAPQARPAHPDGTAPAASALEIRDVPASGARPDAGPRPGRSPLRRPVGAPR
jgi:hypothetical protein